MRKPIVTIETNTVGQQFGTCAVIKSAKSGRVLWTSDTKPYGMTNVARDAAEQVASDRGYIIADEES